MRLLYIRAGGQTSKRDEKGHEDVHVEFLRGVKGDPPRGPHNVRIDRAALRRGVDADE